MRGLGRVRRWIRRVRLAGQPRAFVLLYHRVTELPADPQLMAVSPQHFAEHLEVLRKHWRPFGLQPLVQSLRDRNIPYQGVAVTFDDGYADNLGQAKPLLKCHDVPATVFVAAEPMGAERELWWDDLDRLLLQPGALPETLFLTIQGSPYRWDLGPSGRYSPSDFDKHRRWNMLCEQAPTARHEIHRSLCKLLRPLPEPGRRKALDDLAAWAGAPRAARPTHRTLSAEEVRALADDALVEIGAHTVTHPMLSMLPPEAQRAEIQRGKARLQDILGREVTSFAYPYGAPSDYTPETVALVREAGFACACSNFHDLVWRGSDPFQLPRALVRDWDGDEFARRLEGWFHD